MTVGPTSYDLPIYEDFFSFLPLEKAPPIYLHEFQTRKLKSFRAFIIIWENQIRYKGYKSGRKFCAKWIQNDLEAFGPDLRLAYAVQIENWSRIDESVHLTTSNLNQFLIPSPYSHLWSGSNAFKSFSIHFVTPWNYYRWLENLLPRISLTVWRFDVVFAVPNLNEPATGTAKTYT